METFHFQLFFTFQNSPRLLQRMPQCFAVKLRKLFVDQETSPDLTGDEKVMSEFSSWENLSINACSFLVS